MPVINSNNFVLLVGGVAVAASQSTTININNETIDVTTKDSGNWMEYIAGVSSWDVTSDNLVDLDAAQGIDQLFGLFEAKQPVAIKFGTTTTGKKVFSGMAIFTNLTQTAGTNSAPTWSFSMQGTGQLSEVTNT